MSTRRISVSALLMVVLAGILLVIPTAPANAAFCEGGGVVSAANPSAQVRADCGVFGRPGHRQGYSWTAVNPWGGFQVCVSAKGYVDGKQTWYNIGCGTSGSGTVPWGDVLASPEIRINYVTGVAGRVSFSS